MGNKMRSVLVSGELTVRDALLLVLASFLIVGAAFAGGYKFGPLERSQAGLARAPMLHMTPIVYTENGPFEDQLQEHARAFELLSEEEVVSY